MKRVYMDQKVFSEMPTFCRNVIFSLMLRNPSEPSADGGKDRKHVGEMFHLSPEHCNIKAWSEK